MDIRLESIVVTASSIVAQCFSVAGYFDANDWTKCNKGVVKIMLLFNCKILCFVDRASRFSYCK